MLRTTQELPAGLPVMPRLCVVAPVYNEAECLREFQRRLAAATQVLGREVGVGTECGFGRGPSERTGPLLDVHTAVARAW